MDNPADYAIWALPIAALIISVATMMRSASRDLVSHLESRVKSMHEQLAIAQATINTQQTLLEQCERRSDRLVERLIAAGHMPSGSKDESW